MIFCYPDSPYVRRHGPQGYRDYRSFKPWLRDEFGFRCVYCLWRERWYADGADTFAVDHFIPLSSRPDLICDYDNLPDLSTLRPPLGNPRPEGIEESFSSSSEILCNNAIWNIAARLNLIRKQMWAD